MQTKFATSGLLGRPLFLKLPARAGFGEIFRLLILTECNLRFDAEDAAAGSFEKWANVAAIFAVLDFDELLPERAIFNFLDNSFEDDDFVGFFWSSDNSVGRGNV